MQYNLLISDSVVVPIIGAESPLTKLPFILASPLLSEDDSVSRAMFESPMQAQSTTIHEMAAFIRTHSPGSEFLDYDSHHPDYYHYLSSIFSTSSKNTIPDTLSTTELLLELTPLEPEPGPPPRTKNDNLDIYPNVGSNFSYGVPHSNNYYGRYDDTYHNNSLEYVNENLDKTNLSSDLATQFKLSYPSYYVPRISPPLDQSFSSSYNDPLLSSDREDPTDDEVPELEPHILASDNSDSGNEHFPYFDDCVPYHPATQISMSNYDKHFQTVREINRIYDPDMDPTSPSYVEFNQQNIDYYSAEAEKNFILYRHLEDIEKGMTLRKTHIQCSEYYKLTTVFIWDNYIIDKKRIEEHLAKEKGRFFGTQKLETTLLEINLHYLQLLKLNKIICTNPNDLPPSKPIRKTCTVQGTDDESTPPPIESPEPTFFQSVKKSVRDSFGTFKVQHALDPKTQATLDSATESLAQFRTTLRNMFTGSDYVSNTIIDSLCLIFLSLYNINNAEGLINKALLTLNLCMSSGAVSITATSESLLKWIKHCYMKFSPLSIQGTEDTTDDKLLKVFLVGLVILQPMYFLMLEPKFPLSCPMKQLLR
jgi:hypothetical protein